MARNLQHIRCLDDLSEQSYADIFKVHFQTQDVQVLEVGSPGNMGGVNEQYNSEVKKASLKLRINGEERTIHLFIKIPVDSGLTNFMGKLVRPFMKEAFWYGEAAPLLASKYPPLKDSTPTMYFGSSNFADELRNPGCCKDKCCCLCWFPCRSREEGILILEDLSKLPEPFVMHDKVKILPFSHVKMVLDVMAHFHGAWWLFLNAKDKMPELNVTPDIVRKNFRFQGAKVLKMTLPGMYKKSFQCYAEMRRQRGNDPARIETMLKSVPKFVRALLDTSYFGPTTLKSDLITLVHGDLWSNNMLFQTYKDGSAKSVKIVDFQMFIVAHPLIDLGNFLFIGTDRKFREEYLDTLLESYFVILMSHIQMHLPNMNYDKFRQEFEDHRALFTLGAVFVMPNILNPNQVEIKGLNGMNKVREQVHKNLLDPNHPHPQVQEMQRRTLDLIYEYEDLGIFEKYAK
eukprot:maker-scaffold416_size178335-snap-gene-0.28 protein:Tk04595 transcript:maker-scaffold416_size178335-snap-gene-0.28-mRNA-1 annotation:"PREDICTED: uncharacterized protein LOC100203980"